MPRKRRFKILRWDDRPATTDEYELACPRCHADALLPIGNLASPIIAAWGLTLVFDSPGYIPPSNSMPDEIQCTACRAIWGTAEQPF